jgi:Bacterial RNA polymerase, alpha chain C terminal domain
MGYNTAQDGHLVISPPLDPAQTAWVRAFAQSRRVCRHEERIAAAPDPLREAVGLAVGVDGAFYTGALQDESDETVADWNNPADPVPSLYSAWTVSEDGARLTGRDQAAYPTVWLEVFVEILVGWGRSLSGQVWLQGDDPSDVSRVEVEGDEVIVREITDDPEIARLALERGLPPASALIAQRTLAKAASKEGGGNVLVLPEDPSELDQSIGDLNLSVRAINLLMNLGIDTVRQLAGHSLETLLTNPEDRKVERELREMFQELGWLS